MSYAFDMHGTTFVARYFESMSVQEVELAEQELANDPRCKTATSVFIDLTGVKDVHFSKTNTLEASYIIRAIFNKKKNMKLAVAHTHPQLQELVKIFLNDFRGSEWTVKEFTNCDDAFHWLNSPV